MCKQNYYTRSMARPIFIYLNIELNIICMEKVIKDQTNF